MATYKYQGKATEEFGIHFRSKLEASWAYALNDRQPRLQWEYMDGAWRDFTIVRPWGLMNLEIKPIGPEFAIEAALRVPEGEVLFIARGEPVFSEDRSQLCNRTTCVHRHEGVLYTTTFDWFIPETWEAMRGLVLGRHGVPMGSEAGSCSVESAERNLKALLDKTK